MRMSGWLSVVAMCLTGGSVLAEGPTIIIRGTQVSYAADPVADVPKEGLRAYSQAVNREFGDIAGALRGLDQSYGIRGFRGAGAWTAGSVYLDRNGMGRGIPEGAIIHPPSPIVLSSPKRATCCDPCASALYFIEQPRCACQMTAPGTLPPAPTPMAEPTSLEPQP